MSEHRRSYRLDGLAIGLRCDVAELLGSIDEIFKHHCLAELKKSATDNFDIEFCVTRCAPISIPDEAKVLAVHASGVRLLRHGDDRYIGRQSAYAKIAIGDRRILTTIPAPIDRTGTFSHTDLHLTVVFSLLIALQERGRYAIHSAALSYRDDDGVLIVAPSDQGKSTMAMHLVRNGWSFITDDSVLLKRSADSVQVSAFRRGFAMDESEIAYFPEFADVSGPLLTDPDKRYFYPDIIFPTRRMRRCTPRILVFPEFTDALESTVEQMASRSAFLKLVRQASFLTNDHASTTSQTAVLNKLVQQTSAFRLMAAKDIRRDGERFADLLECSFGYR